MGRGPDDYIRQEHGITYSSNTMAQSGRSKRMTPTAERVKSSRQHDTL